MEEELPQLESANIQRMLKGLSMLEQETRKQRDDTYQEYQRAAIEALKPSFISVIKSMYAQVKMN
jgi:type VI protein secretion system component VasA